MNAFKRLGRTDITIAEVTAIISIHDIITNDGMINFEEFKRIFKNEDKIKPLKLKQQDTETKPIDLVNEF